ncbi:GNAT family N-acetyltransferase [Flavobacteriaceae bacterium]|nr:GNAT family N-acetyltransferase [Flavobacteriaceae bacterium]|tara:strand:- start:6717 stop:7211 length:495 start_codon:yes stop_codon:yes gene_type:complete
MLRLEPFTPKDFSRLIHWVGTKRELIQFAGDLFTFPLSEDQLQEYLSQKKLAPKKIIHTESGEVIGHCELNFLNEHPRLSRILIGNKQKRGRGYGTKIIQLMIDAIQKEIPTKQVELRVFGYNTYAIKLYKKEGFVIQEKHTLQFQYAEDELWTNYYMIKQLHN